VRGDWKVFKSLIVTLKDNGVTIVDEIEEYQDLGKFVHILDPEGNKIELWEPRIDTSSTPDTGEPE
jgi:hypothetical protein